MWLKKIKRGATFNLARMMFGVINIVPRKFAIFVGAMFGLAAWSLLPRDRYRIVRHLTLIYGDRLTFQKRQLLARSYFITVGKNLMDVLRFKTHYEKEIKPLITVEGLHYFEAAVKRGKGVIGFTGHLGNFELLAVHIAGLGYPSAVIGREMYDRRLDEMLVTNRKALKVGNIATTDSVRKIIKWLRDGGIIGVLIDIDSIRVRSTFVPVMGRMALTPVGQTIIGLKTGAAFVPCACVRISDNQYRVIFRPEVTIDRTDDFEADTDRMTAACSKALEEIILEYPDQWIWLKNRWLTKYQNSA